MEKKQYQSPCVVICNITTEELLSVSPGINLSDDDAIPYDGDDGLVKDITFQEHLDWNLW